MLSIKHPKVREIIEESVNTFLHSESELAADQDGQHEMEKEKLARFLNFYQKYRYTSPALSPAWLKEPFPYLLEPLNAIKDKFPKQNIHQDAPKLYYLFRDYLINITLFKLFKAVQIETSRENKISTTLKEIKKELRKLKNSINLLVNLELGKKPKPPVELDVKILSLAAMSTLIGIVMMLLTMNSPQSPAPGPSLVIISPPSLDQANEHHTSYNGFIFFMMSLLIVVAHHKQQLKDFTNHHHSLMKEYASVEKYKENLKKLFWTLPEYYSIQKKGCEKVVDSLRFFYPRKNLIADKPEEIKEDRMVPE